MEHSSIHNYIAYFDNEGAIGFWLPAEIQKPMLLSIKLHRHAITNRLRQQEKCLPFSPDQLREQLQGAPIIGRQVS